MMIGLDYKRKRSLISGIEKRLNSHVLSEYPFLWRRDIMSQVSLHLDFALIYLFYSAIWLSLIFLGYIRYYDPLFFSLIGGIPMLIFFIILTRSGELSKMKIKVPIVGEPSYRDEVIVFIGNMFCKSYLFIYPALFSLFLNISLVPAFESDISSDSESYIDYVLYNGIVEIENKNQLKEQFAPNLLLNECDLDSLIKRVENFKYLELPDSLKEIHGYSSFNDRLLQKGYVLFTDDINSPSKMVYVFNEMFRKRALTHQSSVKSVFKMFFVIFLIICLFSYLEAKYFAYWVDEILYVKLTGFLTKTKLYWIPIVIVFSLGAWGVGIAKIFFSESLSDVNAVPQFIKYLQLFAVFVVEVVATIFLLTYSLFYLFFIVAGAGIIKLKRRIVAHTLRPKD
ncbi:MAG: hypothetical protein AAFY76_00915 [Cyanobacteria bacterium J06649_11]